jgi:formylglycine-generating enzyme required for sulfatase activity
MMKMSCLPIVVLLAATSTARAAEGAARSKAGPAPVVKEPVTGMELVFVKGGCYRMGDLWGDGVGGDGDGTQERPVHEVCVDDFYIGKYEVTQRQWLAVMEKNPSSPANCSEPDCAVDHMSWSDLQAFIAKLNAKAGAGKYRLPTEAEWEYAARSGGKAERYAGGNDIDSVSWYEGNSGARENPPRAVIGHPVGRKAPNGLGLHDMSGNMWEWTNDWYDPRYYEASPRDNPKGPDTGAAHAKRGGCASGHPGNSRTVRRSSEGGPNELDGFRLVRVP